MLRLFKNCYNLAKPNAFLVRHCEIAETSPYVSWNNQATNQSNRNSSRCLPHAGYVLSVLFIIIPLLTKEGLGEVLDSLAWVERDARNTQHRAYESRLLRLFENCYNLAKPNAFLLRHCEKAETSPYVSWNNQATNQSNRNSSRCLPHAGYVLSVLFIIIPLLTKEGLGEVLDSLAWVERDARNTQHRAYESRLLRLFENCYNLAKPNAFLLRHCERAESSPHIS